MCSGVLVSFDAAALVGRIDVFSCWLSTWFPLRTVLVERSTQFM